MPPKPNYAKQRASRRIHDEHELENLEKRLREPINCDGKLFSELPLTQKTLTGLTRSNFVEMTDIQRKAIPLALRGKDVLGAAKTGSGKTLAFLIPLLDNLFRQKWGPQDGLGAIILAPTRELAVQIFQVLCKVGKEHAFSAGLVIGGKDVDVEQDRISRMNILVCTPGRLLQHLDQTYAFDVSNVQMLVLDEADRILDMGFSKSVNAILDHLPKKRQTMLFSATQTKSVRDLARLSLYRPEYVAVHDKAEHSTPAKLTQHYTVVPLPEKLDVLFSFIKTHLKSKVIVFFSSCKQVRFVYETFCKMHPGVPLLQLHGKQKQQKRVEIFDLFTRRPSSFLFCTDIAARGLDFPSVDWVVQVDCPEDAETYIHRVGRTARYDSEGRALLLLAPSEETGMVEALTKKRVPIEKIKIRQGKKQSIQQQLQMLCFKDPEIKYLGQKTFVSYMRSVYLQKQKDVFDVQKLPAEEFAKSLGLPGAPKIKFVQKSEAKNASRRAEKAADEDESSGSKVSSSEESSEDARAKAPRPKTKIDRMFQRKNQGVLAGHYLSLVDRDEDATLDDNASGNASGTILMAAEKADEDDFLTVKRINHDLDDDISKSKDALTTLSERALKRKLRKKAVQQHPQGHKLLFDDGGDAHELYEMETEEQFRRDGPAEAQIQEHLQAETGRLRQTDVEDRELAKQKRREKRWTRKQQQREANEAKLSGGGKEHMEVVLGRESDSYSSDDGAGANPGGNAYVSASESDAAIPQRQAPAKRRRLDDSQPPNLEAQEELALRLLSGVA